MRKPELLAPAGDLSRCKTAIRYGAVAVYIGGQLFSLRSRASNFSIEDIREACHFAKEYGARIHVTVNMIPHEEDFDGLKEYIHELDQAGVTAVIVASVAIMKLVKETAPRLEVHCSTQMSITNSDTAKFLRETLAVDRVVLARECTMDQVYEIAKNSPVDTEAFIHGGMCVNYSGRCTLSNRMTLRDANRGGCAQSCRWQYRVFDGKEELSANENYMTMGSKDLCTPEYIYDLMNAGVASFKIEGRMKTEYYVATIVSAYRSLIDEIYENDGPLSEERMEYHRRQILRGENRETCTGFYSGSAGHDSLIYHVNSDVDVNHDFLGKVISWDSTTKTALIETRNPFSVNDTVEILSPHQAVQAFEISSIVTEKQESIESSRHPMAHVSIPVPFEVKREDILRRARG